MHPSARVLIPADLSRKTREAIRCARWLRDRWHATIDVVYVWTAAAANDAEEATEPGLRAMRELEMFSRTDGAWDVLDDLGALERSGIVQIRGYLTPDPDGAPLSAIAAAAGYDLVLMGIEDEAIGYRVHGSLPDAGADDDDAGPLLAATARIVVAPNQ